MPFLMMLLANRWAQLGIAILATALIVGSWQRYIGYSNEHKERLREVAELNDVITKGAIKAFRLSEQATTSIVEENKKLEVVKQQLAKKDTELKKRIRENEELRAIIIPSSAVQLFNDATNNSPAGVGQGVQDSTNRSNDGATSPPATNLATLLEVATENSNNHLACIHQVDSLQGLVCSIYAADGQPLTYDTCHGR